MEPNAQLRLRCVAGGVPSGWISLTWRLPLVGCLGPMARPAYLALVRPGGRAAYRFWVKKISPLLLSGTPFAEFPRWMG